MASRVVVYPTTQKTSYAPGSGDSQLSFVLPQGTLVPGTATFNAKLSMATAAGFLDAYAGAYGCFQTIEVRSSTLGVLDTIRADSLAAVINAASSRRVPDDTSFTEAAAFGSATVSGINGGVNLTGGDNPIMRNAELFISLDLSKFVGLFATSEPIMIGSGSRLGQVRLTLTLNSDRDALTGVANPATGTYSLSDVTVEYKRVPPQSKMEKAAIDFTNQMKTIEVYSHLRFTLSSGRALAAFQLSRPTRGLVCTTSPQSITAGTSLQAQQRPTELESITLQIRGTERPDYEVVYETTAANVEALYQELYESGSEAVELFTDVRSMRSAGAGQPGADIAGAPFALRNAKTGSVVTAQQAAQQPFAFGMVFDDDPNGSVLGAPGEDVNIVINSAITAATRQRLDVHLSELLVLSS